MTQLATLPQTLHAEQEHPRLRVAVVVALLALYALAFSLFNFLIRQLPGDIASFALPLSCVLAALTAVAMTWLVERWLKRIWLSGYSLTLNPDSLIVRQPAADDVVFMMNGSLSTLAWTFKLAGYKRGGRERRVPENWHCLCCQVQQEDSRLIAYAFAAPGRTAVYTPHHPLRFQKINTVEVYETPGFGRFSPPSRPDKIPADVLSGKDGRYWLAEQRRWREGLELTLEDFETFLQYLAMNKPSE